MHAERGNYPVAVMARVLKVNRTAYYAWVKRGPSARSVADRKLTRLVREIHAANRGVYGAPRIHAELRMEHGIRVSRKRVERLMGQVRISGLIPKRRGKTTVRVSGGAGRR